MLTPTNNWHSTCCYSYFRRVPKSYQKCNPNICVGLFECNMHACILNEQIFVGCQYEWRNGIVCSHLKWNVAVLHYACTFEQFQMFWRTHNIFRIISMWVSLYFDFNFRSVPKFSLSLLDKSIARKFMCVCVCVTSVSIDIYVFYTISFVSILLFHTIFPTFPWCSARVHVMHLYV